MKDLINLKSVNLSKSDLEAREMNALKGGESCTCTCLCACMLCTCGPPLQVPYQHPSGYDQGPNPLPSSSTLIGTDSGSVDNTKIQGIDIIPN